MYLQVYLLGIFILVVTAMPMQRYVSSCERGCHRMPDQSAGQNALLQLGLIDENIGPVHETAGIVQSSEESLN